MTNLTTRNPVEFYEQLCYPTRLLGLDPGSKTIGLAISDSTWLVASPLTTIRRRKFKQDAQELMTIIDRESIGGLVIGYPINMDGTEGPRCQSVNAFSRNLRELIETPILLWDERLTTVAAERSMLEADTSRAKRAERIDQIAASLILQSALERLKNVRKEPDYSARVREK